MTTKILFFGDMMLGNGYLSYNRGIRNYIRKNQKLPISKEISDLIIRSDLSIVNLEAVISDISEKKNITNQIHRANPEVIKLLKENNINAFCFSNNHISEHGNEAFHSCYRLLLENNLHCFGIKKDNLSILEINDIKYGFLNYSFIEDFLEDVPYCKITNSNYNLIFQDIKAALDRIDFLCLVFHWGEEYSPFPSEEQTNLAKKCIDFGADLIVGHHAHVIQGFEKYKDKYIIYGLGNFIFDMTYIKNTRKSLIAEISINSKKETKLNLHLINVNPKNYFVSLVESFEISDNNNCPFSITKTTLNTKTKNKIKRRNIRQAQNQIYSYFLRNIVRYPIKFTFYHIKKFINRRIS